MPVTSHRATVAWVRSSSAHTRSHSPGRSERASGPRIPNVIVVCSYTAVRVRDRWRREKSSEGFGGGGKRPIRALPPLEWVRTLAHRWFRPTPRPGPVEWGVFHAYVVARGRTPLPFGLHGSCPGSISIDLVL